MELYLNDGAGGFDQIFYTPITEDGEGGSTSGGLVRRASAFAWADTL